MTGHALLAPSSANIWVNCPGSVSMGKDIPDEATDDTREGDAVHWLAQSALTMSMFFLTEAKGIEAPNGVIITDMMIDAALAYVQVVNEVTEGTGPLHVEEPVVIGRVHSECWGTPDAWENNELKLLLNVNDLKYGHRFVDAFENWQLICYTLGILDAISDGNGLSEHNNTMVNMRIIQPRCYQGNGPVSSWQIRAFELRPYANKLEAAAEEAMGPDPTLHAGEHCRFCKARHVCPSLLEAAADASDYASMSAHTSLSLAAMAYEVEVLRRSADLIEFRLGALETEALTRIQGGELIPGLSAEHGMGNSKWTGKPDEIITMCNLMGVDVTAPTVPITPTQAIAKFKKEDVDPAVINSYYGRSPTKAKLTIDNNSKIKDIFSKEKI